MSYRQKAALSEQMIENATWPEKILWSRLKRKQIGYRFQRQAVVFGFIVDFICHEARVVIELDGSVHDAADRCAADQQRDSILTRGGYQVLRFRNSDVYRGMSAVLIRIFTECSERAPKKLKQTFALTPRHSAMKISEIEALTAFRQDKRLKLRENNVVLHYRKRRQLNPRNRWITGGDL